MMLLDNRLNRAFGVNEAPPSGLRVLSYAAVLLLGPIPLILVGVLAFVLSSPLLAEIVNINLSWLVEIGSPIVVATFALTLLYKWVPQTPIQWSAAFRGALRCHRLEPSQARFRVLRLSSMDPERPLWLARDDSSLHLALRLVDCHPPRGTSSTPTQPLRNHRR